jgi:hypothetical protein
VNRALAVAAALTLGACVSAPVVPISGTPSQLASLAGEWDGTYSSGVTGGSGSIWFKFIEGEDHAHGDVLMTAAGARMPFRPGPGPYPSGERPKPDRFVSIRFVRAADGVVDGLLDPYWDPACECQVTTAFRGELREARIAGSFISRSGNSVTTGRWEARRRRPASR